MNAKKFRKDFLLLFLFSFFGTVAKLYLRCILKDSHFKTYTEYKENSHYKKNTNANFFSKYISPHLYIKGARKEIPFIG